MLIHYVVDKLSMTTGDSNKNAASISDTVKSFGFLPCSLLIGVSSIGIRVSEDFILMFIECKQ